jgi:hypothetical protein
MASYSIYSSNTNGIGDSFNVHSFWPKRQLKTLPSLLWANDKALLCPRHLLETAHNATVIYIMQSPRSSTDSTLGNKFARADIDP